MGRLTFCVLYEKKYTGSKKKYTTVSGCFGDWYEVCRTAGGQSGVQSENSEQWGIFWRFDSIRRPLVCLIWQLCILIDNWLHVSLLMWQIKHAVKTRQNLQNLNFSVKSRQNLSANSVKVDNWSIDEANMSSWSPANRFLMVFLPRSVWVIELLVFLLPTFKVHKLWEPQFDAYTSPSRSLENASSVQFRAAP